MRWRYSTLVIVYLATSGLPASTQALELSAETVMEKEMAWAKRGIEKYIDKRGHLPVRSKDSGDSLDTLYPLPDNLHKATTMPVSEDSSPSLDEEIEVAPATRLRRGRV